MTNNATTAVGRLSPAEHTISDAVNGLIDPPLSSGVSLTVGSITGREAALFTKFSRSTKGALVMCVASMAMILGVSGTAQAADARVILSDIDGRQLGYADYLDGTDRLKVCDTQRDGYGVIARIRNGAGVIAVVVDDSDAGCNSRAVSLINGGVYVLEIAWMGPGTIKKSRTFRA